MNKLVFLIIGLMLIIGVVLGLWVIYTEPKTPEPRTPEPITSQGILDRIEAAIRAKLKQ